MSPKKYFVGLEVGGRTLIRQSERKNRWWVHCPACNSEQEVLISSLAQNSGCPCVRYEKTKKTNLEKYGVEHNALNPEIKAKRLQTLAENYGVANPFESKEIQQKIRETHMEKYGVETIGSLAETHEKGRKTTLERYGVENAAQLPEFKEKAKATMQERYGVDNYSQTPQHIIDMQKTRKDFNAKGLTDSAGKKLSK